MSSTTEHLHDLLNHLINDRHDQADLTLHNYVLAKTREVTGLGQTPVGDPPPEEPPQEDDDDLDEDVKEPQLPANYKKMGEWLNRWANENENFSTKALRDAAKKQFGNVIDSLSDQDFKRMWAQFEPGGKY